MSGILSKASFLGCYFLSYSYALAAAVNEGVTGYFLGIPFVLFLIADIEHPKTHLKLKVLNLLFLVSVTLLHFVDRSTFLIFHPILGSNVSVQKELVIGHNPYFPFQIEIHDDSKTNQPIYTLNKGTTFILTHAYKKDGGGILGNRKVYRVNSNNKEFEELFIRNANAKNVNPANFDSTLQTKDVTSLFISDLLWSPTYNKNFLEYFQLRVEPWKEALSLFSIYLDVLLVFILYIPLLMLFSICCYFYFKTKKLKPVSKQVVK